MSRRKFQRLLAYFYMPAIFVVIGYLIVYLAAGPVIAIVQDLGGMFISENTPDFSGGPGEDFKGFSVKAGEQEETIPLKDVKWPEYAQHYGQLTCAEIGLDAPVYWGDDNGLLRKGVGQYTGSYIPGYGGTILLAGHNTTFFAPFQKVKKGDVITFETEYGIFKYRITGTKVLNHKDKEAFDLEALKEQLVMYTCYPFERLAGTKTDRLFVYGKKISGPKLIRQEEQHEQ